MAEWLLVVTVLWKQTGVLATEWVEPMESYAVCIEEAAKWDAQRLIYNSLDFISVLGDVRCEQRVNYEWQLGGVDG